MLFVKDNGKPYAQEEDETTMQFMRRVIRWLDHEDEAILDDLPSPDAIVDYFSLWIIYDTARINGIYGCIKECGNPEPFDRFVDHYKLSWPKAKHAERV